MNAMSNLTIMEILHRAMIVCQRPAFIVMQTSECPQLKVNKDDRIKHLIKKEIYIS